MGVVETTQEPSLKGAVCQAVDPAVDLLQGCGKRSVAFTPAPTSLSSSSWAVLLTQPVDL